MPIEWESKYVLGFHEIDEQHRMFVKTIDELYEAIRARKTEAKLTEIFKKVDYYIAKHFSAEESLFHKTNYPKTDSHIAEHRRFKEKIESIKRKISHNEMEISFELVDFLEDWLVHHLSDVDKLYIKHFQEHGIK
jgi:hemerythrin-like metal-binding protein